MFDKSCVSCGRLVALSAVLLAIGPLAVAAEHTSEEPLRCLQASRIDTTEVLNNRRIVFTTVRGLNYLNVLPAPCPGLRRGEPFMYRTSIDLLCDIDLISVLDNYGGGYRPGASCALGRFLPIEKEEVQELREGGQD